MQKFLLLLFISAVSLRAETPWPGIAYKEVRAYAWDPDPRLTMDKPFPHLLIHDDMSFADDVLNKDGALLSASQVKRLLTAEAHRWKERGKAACYEPHNAFVFFDANHQPVAYLELCLDCLGARTSPRDQECDPDFIALAALCHELKLPFGESKTLKKYRKSVGWVLRGDPLPPAATK
jgi:hypothetical protein